MNKETLPLAKFRLGRIKCTPSVLSKIHPEEILEGIRRHQSGDWGEVEEADKLDNEAALRERRSLCSIYRSGKGIAFWLVTEGDRSATTVLLPEEY